jgi:hypothetical protein
MIDMVNRKAGCIPLRDFNVIEFGLQTINGSEVRIRKQDFSPVYHQ